LEEGALVQDGRILLRRGGRDEGVLPASKVPLPGRHNLANALACAAAAIHCGVAAPTIGKAIGGFPGLPHRLERVAEVAGVCYYNDSKATNVGATLRALESFDAPVILMLGGYDKGGEFETLSEPLRSGRVRALVTFGKAGDDIARRLEKTVPQ